MTQPIISARNVGKEYRLGELTRSNTLRDAISGMFSRKAQAPETRRHGRHIWALKDISFDVAEGEVLGIIGANGAGKSTLLKILSRITEPSIGEIELRGRVASLLEVGTGFNDELTGRENIILNGAILGMSKREIDKKFDEIVSFSGVERFIETPVKHYSSGMKMRLAFAVAAHLEPEILIIDEVLAVGDAEFQRKCLGKMDDVARSGRTVLFVSHNMAAVESLCTRAILLEQGRLTTDADAASAVELYRKSQSAGRMIPTAANFLDECRFANSGDGSTAILMGDDFELLVSFRTPTPTRKPKAGVVLRSAATAAPVFDINTEIVGVPPSPTLSDSFTCSFTFAGVPLVCGEYVADMWLGADGQTFEVIRDAATLQIIESDVYGTGRLPSAHLGTMFVRPKVRLEARRVPFNQTTSASG